MSFSVLWVLMQRSCDTVWKWWNLEREWLRLFHRIPFKHQISVGFLDLLHFCSVGIHRPFALTPLMVINHQPLTPPPPTLPPVFSSTSSVHHSRQSLSRHKNICSVGPERLRTDATVKACLDADQHTFDYQRGRNYHLLPSRSTLVLTCVTKAGSQLLHVWQMFNIAISQLFRTNKMTRAEGANLMHTSKNVWMQQLLFTTKIKL